MEAAGGTFAVERASSGTRVSVAVPLRSQRARQLLTGHYTRVGSTFLDVQDRAVFAEVAVLQRTPRRRWVSAAALEIHVRAVARSARTEYPAFVGYADLDAIGPGSVSTLAAVELCLADLWVQARDGYVVTDNELIERLSGGSVDWWFHHRLSRVVDATSRALRRVWRALNEERFIPL